MSFDNRGVRREGENVIPYGSFLTALVSFLIVAFVLFLVVKAYNRARAPQPVTSRACPYCTTEISVAATRCPHCTSEVTPQPA